MADTTTLDTAGTEMKRNLSYDDKVIKKIAGIATEGVEGVLALSGGLIGNITDRFRNNADKTKGIDAEVGQKQVALDLNVVCEYGKNVPRIFDAVIEKVSDAMMEMTGLEVVEINMHVEDVLGHAEFEEMRKSQQSKQQAAPAVQEENYDSTRVH